MARIGRPGTPCHVPLAVSAWSRLTAFESLDRRSENAVMSNWCGSLSTPRPISSTRSRSSVSAISGPATLRTRSTSKRSLPADTGVWIVKTVPERDAGERVVERHPPCGEFAGLLDQHERRVALVEMPRRGLHAQRPQCPHAADAQHQLLVKPHLAATHVQDVGDGAVLVGVLGDVRVQQQQRDAADLHEPDGDLHGAPGQLHLDHEAISVGVGDALEWQAQRVEVRVGVLLVAVGVDGLAEVAPPVEEADRHERQRHVRRRLAVVAGQDAEAPGVDAE